jgi:catalase
VPTPQNAHTAEKTLEATAGRVADALEGTYGVQRGQRRNHAKGVGALGSFVGTPEAAKYSCSPLFSGQSVEVVARFSLAGGDPNASDTERSARGLGLQFRLPNGGLHHMTMLNTPMFFAAMPKTFLDKFLALKPDPVTGKPDPKKWQAFVSSHADTASQFHYLDTVNPPPSYAHCAFYSVHTFQFVDREAKMTKVRWRFVPQDGELQLPTAQLNTMPRDFLNQALIDRTGRGPARWDMIVTLGEPGDSESDPTILWPLDRKEFKAGTLTITSAMDQVKAGSYKINYDPLLMGDGIAPSDDPVLLFRSASYGTSFTRRIRNL